MEASANEAVQLGLTGVPSFAIRGPGTKGLKLLRRVADAGDLENAIASAKTG